MYKHNHNVEKSIMDWFGDSYFNVVDYVPVGKPSLYLNIQIQQPLVLLYRLDTQYKHVHSYLKTNKYL